MIYADKKCNMLSVVDQGLASRGLTGQEPMGRDLADQGLVGQELMGRDLEGWGLHTGPGMSQRHVPWVSRGVRGPSG